MTDVIRDVPGFRFAETVFGDSLQSIAYRELGDASRWPEIVALNNLKPPYISDLAAGDGVLLSGSLVRIPAAQREATATTDPDLVFEIDIQLDRNGDPVLDVGGDFGQVSGLDNFKQAVKNRIDVDNGDLPFHPAYGSRIRTVIGAMNGPTRAALAAAYASAAIAADSRVRRVVSSTAQVRGDSIAVTVFVEPIIGRIVDLTQVL